MHLYAQAMLCTSFSTLEADFYIVAKSVILFPTRLKGFCEWALTFSITIKYIYLSYITAVFCVDIIRYHEKEVNLLYFHSACKITISANCVSE